MKKLIEKANTLVEALPYIRAFSGKTVVIKYGGAAMSEEKLKDSFAEDVVLMKFIGLKPVVVHGGGPQINTMMKRLGKEPKFVKGVRVTDASTMEVVEMVLGGMINKEIVALINSHGGRAVGLSGKDGRLIRAKKLRQSEGPRGRTKKTAPDMGFVGEVDDIDPRVIESLDQDRFIPVIAPIGADAKGQTYNINADLVAGSIAAALKAEKLVVLTDVKGILDSRKNLVPTINRKDTSRMIKKGTIKGGMIPKIQAGLTAVEGGVHKAHIIDGRVPHAL
ncbi:MAG TPA: acetylglutamate kinase, partial [Nitrospiria bacterium]|nr:acetylglutamate kinase [Nitrospiria bacterium]